MMISGRSFLAAMLMVLGGATPALSQTLIAEWRGPLSLKQTRTVLLTPKQPLASCAQASLRLEGLRARPSTQASYHVVLNAAEGVPDGGQHAPGYVGQFSFYGLSSTRKGSGAVSFQIGAMLRKLADAQGLGKHLSVTLTSPDFVDDGADIVVGRITLWCTT